MCIILMLARTHIAGSLLAGLMLKPISLSFSGTFTYFGMVILGTMLMDLDHPHSTISQEFPITSWITNKILGHRGFFHSIFVPLGGWSVLLYLNFPLAGTGLLVGMASHLILDSLTKQGIHLLKPFSSIRLKGFISTGGLAEKIFYWSTIGIIGLIILLSL